MADKNSASIIIVDDTPANLDVLGSILTEENYDIRAFANGPMALRLAIAEPPDLILLDIKMPAMNGYEVCTTLKADERTRDIPVIFISALQETADKLQAFEAGGVDYITKPFQAAEVLARVRTHVKLKQMHEELQSKNVMLEEAARLRDDVDRIMHHDLKNPLNSIMNLPSLLIKTSTDLTDEATDWLRTIERSGHKMLDMINRSLDLYKMETGSYQLNLQAFDLLPILKNSANEIERLHAASQKSACILYQGETAADDLQIWVDGEIMLCYPLFSNLLQNAFEASPDGGNVEIELDAHDEQYITISITNIGTVPEAIRERFFDKYVTAGKEKGTGLGTYSAKLCAETQEGSIRLEPMTDKTRISVELKRHKHISMAELQAIIAEIEE